MKKIVCLFIQVVFSIFTVLFFSIAQAQEVEIPEFSGSLGSVIGPESFEQIESEYDLQAADDGSTKYTINPAFVKTDDADLFGASFSVSSGKHSFAARALEIDPNAADSFAQFRLQYKYSIERNIVGAKWGIIAQIIDTEDIRQDIQAIASARWGVGRFNISGNIAWKERDPDQGDSIDDVGLSIGVSTVISDSFDLGLSYTFEDDINGDDSVSAGITVPVGGVGKSAGLVTQLDDSGSVTLAFRATY